MLYVINYFTLWQGWSERRPELPPIHHNRQEILWGQLGLQEAPTPLRQNVSLLNAEGEDMPTGRVRWERAESSRTVPLMPHWPEMLMQLPNVPRSCNTLKFIIVKLQSVSEALSLYLQDHCQAR